jgi:hypothetical protein
VRAIVAADPDSVERASAGYLRKYADSPYVGSMVRDEIRRSGSTASETRETSGPGYVWANAASSSFGACCEGSRDPRSTTPRVRPPRRATPTKQRPAAEV